MAVYGILSHNIMNENTGFWHLKIYKCLFTVLNSWKAYLRLDYIGNKKVHLYFNYERQSLSYAFFCAFSYCFECNKIAYILFIILIGSAHYV